MNRLNAIAFAAVLAAGVAGTAANADTWPVSQDTYVYEFLGNQGAGTGDSGGILVWNHESIHGAQALLQVEGNWASDSALAGEFEARLHLYQVCDPGGFVGACPGDAGAEIVITDFAIQETAWTEADFVLGWTTIVPGTVNAQLMQDNPTDGWVSVDVTDIVAAWVGGMPDYGIAVSQEAYDVIRADNGAVAVSSFCDSESSFGVCATQDLRPFLEIVGVADTDADGVADAVDNCLLVSNPARGLVVTTFCASLPDRQHSQVGRAMTGITCTRATPRSSSRQTRDMTWSTPGSM
ncbi:MAG: hypothetical protein AAF479_04370 [Pseudomonadota bacterium]